LKYASDLRSISYKKNVGNLEIPPTPEGTKVQYVLDGQQRITSLYAAYLGAEIQKTGEKKITDYHDIVVNLDKDINGNDNQVISAEPLGEKYLSLNEVLNFSFSKAKALSDRFSEDELELVDSYSTAFKTYEFSTVVLRKEDIDSAIEVFTRINTGGQTLTLFEIMAAKTYDEKQNFDMQTKWSAFISELKDIKYEGISRLHCHAAHPAVLQHRYPGLPLVFKPVQKRQQEPEPEKRSAVYRRFRHGIYGGPSQPGL